MTAPVRIEGHAWGDLRFATLARLCGFADAEHALIKCAKIWSWQTEHYTPDAPTYIVDPELVESALGEGGAQHMVRARLAEAGPDGLRIKGSKGKIEWLYKKRLASAAGGEATKRKWADESGPDGLPMAEPEPMPQAGPDDRPTPGALPLAPVLPLDRKISEIHTRARERHPAAGGIARRVWDYGAKVRGQLAKENVQVAAWAITVGSDHSGWTALLDRVCELLVGSTPEEAERVARNRIDVGAAKARLDGEGHWFANTALFTRNSFEHFAQLDPAQFTRKPAKKRPAGELIGSARPRSDHPDNPISTPIRDLK